MPNALVVQHEPTGPSGHIGERLAERGYDLHVVQVLDGVRPESTVPLPSPDAFDLVVPLGSVHSVYDHGTIGTWIHRELDLLRTAHEQGVPVLGVCFGCQSLAAALGGGVEPAPRAEIGWIEIDSDTPAIGPGPWLSWHLDRVQLPPGAVELARTDVSTQAWRAGRSLAVQFHPEVGPAMLDTWIGDAGPEYFARKGLDPQVLRDGMARHGDRARAECRSIVDWFLDEVATS